MNRLIDLHCHLLPGIDDGPPDMPAAVELARRAADEGVQTIAATPHLRADFPDVVPGELADRCQEVRDRLRAEGIAVDVLPAAEVDLLWALEAGDDDLRLCSYGQRGTDLLLETPYSALPAGFEELLFRITLAGYRVLLAHPERNPSFQTDPERLAALAGRGVLLQVTASSLVRGHRGAPAAGLAQQLVRLGLAHAIASDAHGVRTIARASLAAGVERAGKLVGAERAGWLAADAPGAIAAGQQLPPMPDGRPQRRGLLSRVRGM
jgi:protein-tyrosine phosphatase